jgi:uncharacterized protein (DUF4213/DUF364 family)
LFLFLLKFLLRRIFLLLSKKHEKQLQYMQKIYQKVLELAGEKYGIDVRDVWIREVIAGKFLTAVRLSLGSVGFSLTEYSKTPFLYRSERDFGAFTPNNISGRSVWELFGTKTESPDAAALKLACANALSSAVINAGHYHIIPHTDPFDLVKIHPGDKVTLVGAFSSYIRKLRETSCKLRVLELDETAMRAENKKYYRPAHHADKVIPDSDLLIITGSTLVNNTLNKLTQLCCSHTKVILVGPSAGLLPEVLFLKGIDIIGSLRITDTDAAMRTVAEGGTGYHLFKYGAEKISVLKEKK